LFDFSFIFVKFFFEILVLSYDLMLFFFMSCMKMIEKLILFFELIFGVSDLFVSILKDRFIRFLEGGFHRINKTEYFLQGMMLIFG